MNMSSAETELGPERWHHSGERRDWMDRNGIDGEEESDASQYERGNSKYHVVVTSSGGVYMNWQVIIFHYHYSKLKQRSPNSALGGFTRLLHSEKADELMDVMNTVLVEGLHLHNRNKSRYLPINRPWAVQQWLQKHDIEEDYVLIGEPDHILLRAPPLLASPYTIASYPFPYMRISKHWPLLQQYDRRGAGKHNVWPIGPSPVQIHKQRLRETAPLWVHLALEMQADPEVQGRLGWVLEMYAFAMAASQLPDGPLQVHLHSEMLLEPPWATSLTPMICSGWWCRRMEAHCLHYTYGQDFSREGRPLHGQAGWWHWDKRDHRSSYPKPIPPPPAGTHEVTRKLVQLVNEAIEHAAGWRA